MIIPQPDLCIGVMHASPCISCAGANTYTATQTACTDELHSWSCCGCCCLFFLLPAATPASTVAAAALLAPALPTLAAPHPGPETPAASWRAAATWPSPAAARQAGGSCSRQQAQVRPGLAAVGGALAAQHVSKGAVPCRREVVALIMLQP
jgi:hypothetical protein